MDDKLYCSRVVPSRFMSDYHREDDKEPATSGWMLCKRESSGGKAGKGVLM